ncbi:hypothetical protein diail_11724 [Diaporthe ilicicola]|nr:hypothetical protein diail_11724 [Diaporthe ilicicola]
MPAYITYKLRGNVSTPGQFSLGIVSDYQSRIEDSSTDHPAIVTNKINAKDIGSQIPAFSTSKDHRILSRQKDVEDALSPLLKSQTRLRYIDEEHECFELESVVAFREQYDIKLDGNPWKNFKRLLCGSQDLPFIILLNPTTEHEFEYERMKKCPTLEWITEVLGEIGLALENVVIVDICSLLSDNDLRRMGKGFHETWDAVEESYAMVEDILEFLSPSTIISCQCATMGQYEWRRVNGRMKKLEKWPLAINGLARALCSSEKNLRDGITKEIQIGSHSTLCVCGIHPRRLDYRSGEHMTPWLRGAFKDVFVPCVERIDKEKREVAVASKMETRRSGSGTMAIETKGERPSSMKPNKVAETEVDEETGELDQSFAAMKLSSS